MCFAWIANIWPISNHWRTWCSAASCNASNACLWILFMGIPCLWVSFSMISLTSFPKWLLGMIRLLDSCSISISFFHPSLLLHMFPFPFVFLGFNVCTKVIFVLLFLFFITFFLCRNASSLPHTPPVITVLDPPFSPCLALSFLFFSLPPPLSLMSIISLFFSSSASSLCSVVHDGSPSPSPPFEFSIGGALSPFFPSSLLSFFPPFYSHYILLVQGDDWVKLLVGYSFSWESSFMQAPSLRYQILVTMLISSFCLGFMRFFCWPLFSLVWQFVIVSQWLSCLLFLCCNYWCCQIMHQMFISMGRIVLPVLQMVMTYYFPCSLSIVSKKYIM